MRIVKLDAISSTNDFLKEMSRNSIATNFTVVTAENQTSGKGQRGTKWESEGGKNLMFSIYIDQTDHFIDGIFSMNVAVAMAIFTTVKAARIKNVAVKWPNDIMADGKKLGGILIENTIKADGSFTSIIGIGLNINQTNFTHLPTATSIALQVNEEIDKSDFLNQLLLELQSNLSTTANQEEIWNNYRKNLFRVNILSNFEDATGKRFEGTVEDVDYNGRLIVNVDNKLKLFSLKEIKLIY